MASSLAYDTIQVVAREVQAFGDAEALGLAAIAFAIFIGGFVVVIVWQFLGKALFKIWLSIPWKSCCGFCRGRKSRRHHHYQSNNKRSYREEDELVGEVRPRQDKGPRPRKRHPFHNLWHLFVLLVSMLVVISAVFWALHVMHTPFSVIASLGIFGYVFGQAAGSIIANVFCGIVLYFTDEVEIGDYIEIPGKGKGVVRDMRALWIILDDPNDDCTKDKTIFLNNSCVVYGPLWRYDKWASLLNNKSA